MTKDEIRAIMRERARAYPVEQRQVAGRQAQEHVLASSWYQAAERIGCYLATAVEMPTRLIFEQAIADGKTIAAPRYNAEHGSWSHACLSDPDDVIMGDWRVPEPRSQEVIDALDLVIVPGRAFDRAGNRVGHGQGHYDQMLEGCSGTCVGLAFDWQVLPDLPHEDHDRIMHGLCTESGVFTMA